jgi:hypothetical protein
MRKLIIINSICLLFFSCSKKHIRTERICDQKLYMEIYERNQLGISYLTDSTNFRIYVNQLNFENERYAYKCVSDSVFVFKISRGLGNGSKDDEIIAQYKYDINALRKEKRFEK